MAKKKFDGLEVQLASSILFYDEQEMLRFFDIYDGISEEHMLLDGMFDLFVSYIRRFDKWSDDVDERRGSLIKWVLLRNDQEPNVKVRENFELWFQAACDMDVPMELADDILDHFVWEAFKRAIDAIDKSNTSFKDKLAVRPKIPKALHRGGLVNIDEVSLIDGISGGFVVGGDEVSDLNMMVRPKPTNFMIIAARPGVGKSLMMMEMAIANALNGVDVLFVSLEMNKVQITERIINFFAGENLRKQHEDEYGVLDVDGFQKAVNAVKASKIYKKFIKKFSLLVTEKSSAEAILTDIEDNIHSGGYKNVYLDYLQIMRYSGMDEWASLRTLTKDCKNLAFRTQILLVAGSQVSRSSTDRGLYLTDLFGSSTLEADPDIVLGLENPRERRQNEKAPLNTKVMKNRDGELGEFKYIIDYSCGRMIKNEQ